MRWTGGFSAFFALATGWSVALEVADMPADSARDSGWNQLTEPSAVAPEALAGAELKAALELIARGEFDQAIGKAQAVLDKDPKAASACEVLGICLVKKGELKEGMVQLQRAIEINPKQNTAITKMGDVYLAQGELPKAKAEFLRAIGINPGDRFAHQRLGLLLEKEGNEAEAITHLEQGIIGTSPDYLGIKLDLGRLYNRSGQYRKTVALLQALVTDDCKSPSAQLVLGAAYFALNDPKAAMVCFSRARGLEPEAERARLALGIAYREAADYAASLGELDAVLGAKPDSVDALCQKAETLVAMGRTPDGLECFAVAVGKSPQATEIQNRMAEVLVNAKRNDEAIALYEQVRRQGQPTMRTYDGLATVYQITGDLEAAKRVLEEACKKDFDPAFANYRLGLLFAYAKDYSSAQRSFETAVKASPSDPRLLKALSLAYSRQGNRNDAIATARKLTGIAPDSVEDAFYLATLVQDNQDYETAINEYRAVLKRNPKHVLAMNNLAALLAERGQIDEALPIAQGAATLAPEMPAVQDTYGWIQFQKGAWQAARVALEIAVAKAPGNPTYRYHLAATFAKLGDPNAAAAHAKQALASSQPFSEMKDAAALLQGLQR